MSSPPTYGSYEVPTYTHAYRIEVGAGGTAVDSNWEFPLDFKADEWDVNVLRVVAQVSQTYSSGASFDIETLIVNYNPNQTGGLMVGTLNWAGFDTATKVYDDQKTFGILPGGVRPERLAFKINTNYILAFTALTPQVCNVTLHLIAVATQLVPNPTTQPTWRTPSHSGRAAELDLATLGFYALLGVGGLIALAVLAPQVVNIMKESKSKEHRQG